MQSVVNDESRSYQITAVTPLSVAEQGGMAPCLSEVSPVGMSGACAVPLWKSSSAIPSRITFTVHSFSEGRRRSGFGPLCGRLKNIFQAPFCRVVLVVRRGSYETFEYDGLSLCSHMFSGGRPICGNSEDGGVGGVVGVCEDLACRVELLEHKVAVLERLLHEKEETDETCGGFFKQIDDTNVVEVLSLELQTYGITAPVLRRSIVERSYLEEYAQ